MSCPLNKNRWKGSGYRKESTTMGGEMEAKMLEMQKSREILTSTSTPSQQTPLRIEICEEDDIPCKVCTCKCFFPLKETPANCKDCRHSFLQHGSR